MQVGELILNAVSDQPEIVNSNPYNADIMKALSRFILADSWVKYTLIPIVRGDYE